MSYPHESAWKRALRDSESLRKESPLWFWGVEVMGGLILGALGRWAGFTLIPSVPSEPQIFWYPSVGSIFGVLIGLVGAFLTILFLNLLRAPYKQRDEALDLLLAKPKPIPLQNRKELIEAIALVENTTLNLMEEEDSIDKLLASAAYPETAGLKEARASSREAYARWVESFGLLHSQYLVAGDEYETIALGFKDFVWIRVMAKMKVIGFNIGDQPWVFGSLGIFAGELGRKVKETIQKINDLSGQAPDKEGSLG